jgi:ABC-2 type transport system ATP-binding protein/lipopolysaccharide transport system ATP-binding protein
MAAHAIEVRDLGKRYVLGQGVFGYDTVREALSRGLSRRGPRTAEDRELWALRDLDVDISQGEVTGIVGRNGAGKTTLLKILSRITTPTEGVARTRGRVGALLEVGTGFHPELTGRENVYLNGAVLGMTRRDTRHRFDEIVEFAGVERFLDTPLKRYSTGMYLRLAFAVAAHLEPDIVVVDEVLAVGDAEFQRRCLGKMSDFRQEGRTVIFVSHDLGAVGRLCNRGVWLDRGRLVSEGRMDDVLRRYMRATAGHPSSARFDDLVGGPIRLNAVDVVAAGREDSEIIQRDEALRISLEFETAEAVPGLNLAVYVVASDGARVIDDALGDAPRRARDFSPGGHLAAVTLPPFLPAGEYVLGVWFGSAYEEFLDREILTFQIWPRGDDLEEAVGRPRVVQPILVWDVRSENE